MNRLQRAHEYTGNTQLDWQQEYVFDRYGNRTIHQTNTWGGSVNKKDFTVNTANNQLGVPGGQSGTMTYDSAGNLTTDTYSGSGVTRAYDAENRMTSETQASNYVAGVYNYNADGQRVRRRVGNVETWQIYGLDGELLAEYAANTTPASPQKEYGYRNGQLLITADAAPAVAASFVKTDTATQGNWRGMYGTDGYNIVNDSSSYPSYAQVSVSGQSTYGWASSTSDARALQKASAPGDHLAACWYSSTNFTIDVNLTDGNSHQVALYAIDWDGSNVRQERFEVLDASTNAVLDTRDVSSYSNGKYLVWLLRGHVKIKLTHLAPTGYSAVVSGLFFDAELPRTNVARAADGAVATASSTLDSGRTALAAINGDRQGQHWGSDPATGSGWHDATNATYPDWLQVDFDGSKTIDEVDVFSVQDNVSSPSEPTATMTFSQYGITDFQVQYWNGSAWTDVSGGNVTGNNQVWRKFTFTQITTAKVRVLVNSSLASYSRVVELEAWGTATGSGSGGFTANISWLVTDQLGTPRMVFDQTGSLAAMKRHDYLPFGEELFAGTGGRTSAQGYGADNVRQKFTQKERDNETGLDYFEARYYSSTQGRFTRPDPYNIVLETQATAETNEDKARAQFFNYLSHPQNWNRYAYVTNNPLKYIDPTGEELWLTGTDEERKQELERIKNLVGKDAAKYLTTTEICTKDGTITVVGYKSNAFAAFQPEVTTRIANIIDSKDVLEYHIATTFQDKNGNHTTEYFGGAATVGKEESLNGHTQIFVNPNGSDIAQNVLGVPSVLAGSRSNDGKPLDFYDDIVDYHEFGHAYANMIDRVNVNSDQSNQRSLDFENVIRQRRGLSNRRVRH